MPDPTPSHSRDSADSVSPKNPERKSLNQTNPALYAQLKAEAKAPYRGLRQFVYFACGASGFVGAFIFLTQLLAGRDVANAMPNFALQVGVVALMVGLFRLEARASRRQNRDS
jgi:hypothetical protein